MSRDDFQWPIKHLSEYRTRRSIETKQPIWVGEDS